MWTIYQFWWIRTESKWSFKLIFYLIKWKTNSNLPFFLQVFAVRSCLGCFLARLAFTGLLIILNFVSLYFFISIKSWYRKLRKYSRLWALQSPLPCHSQWHSRLFELLCCFSTQVLNYKGPSHRLTIWICNQVFWISDLLGFIKPFHHLLKMLWGKFEITMHSYFLPFGFGNLAPMELKQASFLIFCIYMASILMNII